MSGFGQTGPYSKRGAYDNVIQTYSGLADAQSDPSGEPGFIRQLLADKLAAFAGAQAVSSALVGRERGLGGQHVELCLLDTAIAPGLGQHSDEILSELGFGERCAELREAGVVA